MTGNQKLQPGSNRSFGLVFAVAFAVIALWPLLHGGELRVWAAIVGAAFLVVALVIPAILAPLNRVWFRFGLLLGHIVSPIVMALVFVLAVIPTGLILKLLRKDVLKLALEPDRETYWEPRMTPPGSMKNQY